MLPETDLDAFSRLRAGLAEHEAVLLRELPGLLVRHVALGLQITLVPDQKYHLKMDRVYFWRETLKKRGFL